MPTKRDRLVPVFVLLGVLSAVSLAQAVGAFEAIDWGIFMAERRRAMKEMVHSFIMEKAKLASVDELVQAFGGDLLLPTWMPGDITLRKIYIWPGCNETFYGILSYSDREINDYLDADISISLLRPSEPDSVETLEHVASVGSGELVKIGDIWAIARDQKPGFPVTVESNGKTIYKGWANEPQPASLYFWKKDIYYTVSGFVSKDILIQIVESMESAS